MNAYGSRFVGKLARGFFILKLKKKERQEETEEEYGTLIPRRKIWILIRKSFFHWSFS